MTFDEEITNFSKPDFPISSHQLDNGGFLILVGEEGSVFDPNQLVDLINELKYHLDRVRQGMNRQRAHELNNELVAQARGDQIEGQGIA
jgi:hypothetical protein